MKRSDLACVVLNWNGGTHVIDCMRSVYGSSLVPDTVLVVDNGSTDDSPKALMQEFPRITFLKHEKNIGLVAARNEAIAAALRGNAEFIFFLDNDAEVSQECLAQLCGAAGRTPAAGIFTPRILEAGSGGRIWFDGGRISRAGDAVHERMGRKIEECPDVQDGQTRETTFATGCAMLVRSAVFEQVGLFDRDFFVYSEDADFSYRARAQGFSIVHVPYATVRHRQSSDTKANRGKWFRDYYVTRNKLLLAHKHIRGWRWIAFSLNFTARSFLMPMAYFVLTGQLERARAVWQGTWDCLGGKVGERFS